MSDARFSLLRTPERFVCWNELDWNFTHEGFQPSRALFHAGLFGWDVTENDQGLLFALAGGVCDVLYGFPLLRFADHESLNPGHFQRLGMIAKSSGAGSHRHFGHAQSGVSNHPNDVDSKLALDIGREFFQRSFRNVEQVLIVSVLKLFPSQGANHAGFDAIRITGVPVVVESPDD